MMSDRARDEFAHALPREWTLDDLKPVGGSHWQIELAEMRDDRDDSA